MSIRFAKGHGTENDFVLLPDPDGALALTPNLVRALCNRRSGVGADGVLRVVRSAKHPDAADHAADAEWFMDFHNADGTAGEMCGNGLRLFAHYLVTAGRTEPGTFTIATRAGLRGATVEGSRITVDARRPTLGERTAAIVAGVTYEGVAVDVGNPHLVCYVDSAEVLASLDLSVAPTIDPRVLPAGANVEFVLRDSGETGDDADLAVRMRVHERGVGETRSCGTGACAVAAVVLADAGRTDGTVAVAVPGGRLVVRLAGDSGLLSGPATVVAAGELDDAWVAAVGTTR